MKVFYDALKRTIDNGTYAAMYDDTVALDNAMSRKLVTQQEHDDLVAYWHEKYDAPAQPEEPTNGQVDLAGGAVDSGANDPAGASAEPTGDVAPQ